MPTFKEILESPRPINFDASKWLDFKTCSETLVIDFEKKLKIKKENSMFKKFMNWLLSPIIDAVTNETQHAKSYYDRNTREFFMRVESIQKQLNTLEYDKRQFQEAIKRMEFERDQNYSRMSHQDRVISQHEDTIVQMKDLLKRNNINVVFEKVSSHV